MKSIYYLMYIVCFSLALAACTDDVHDDDREDDDETDINTLSIVGSLNADDEPALITEELEEDTEEIFGEADDETTDVLANDTVQSVIDRAESD